MASELGSSKAMKLKMLFEEIKEGKSIYLVTTDRIDIDKMENLLNWERKAAP